MKKSERGARLRKCGAAAACKGCNETENGRVTAALRSAGACRVRQSSQREWEPARSRWLCTASRATNDTTASSASHASARRHVPVLDTRPT